MRFTLIATCLMAASASAPRAQQEMQLFTVGSGDIGGSYYAAAGALCANLNRSSGSALRCSPEPTSGSLYNLTMLWEGELDFAFAQSDWQQIAYEGGGPIARGAPMTGLRSVMALYPEMITVIARRDAGIAGTTDLLGKRVDIGQPGSGRNASLTRLLAALDIDRTDFAELAELPTASALDELCAGRIDASILIVGHPNDTVTRVLTECDVELVPFAGPALTEAMATMGRLQPITISAGSYPRLEADVQTYAVIATIVTDMHTDPAIVRSLVATALADLPELAARAPVLAGMTPETMRSEGLTAPLHPGAEAAFNAAAEN
jgi:TRAP transporter TAXI family solute receptor